MQRCADILNQEPVLTLPQVCRNLWNFQALQFYDKHLFNKFGDIIVKNFDKMNETDVANAVRAFAEFDHV